MTRKSLPSLLSVLLLTLAASGVAAVEPTDELAEPAAQPVLVPEPTSAPATGCSESSEAATASMSILPGVNRAEAADVLASEAGWWSGICWTSCFPCWSDYDCPWNETCRFNVQCP